MALEIIILTGLVILAVILFMVEIFLLPGITIASVAGIIMLLGSVVYAFHYIGETAGYITIAANIILSVGSFIYLVKSKALNRIELKTNIDAKVDIPELYCLQVGQKGIAISRINPIGKAEFDEKYIVEAKSVSGEFIDEGQAIEIIKIDKSNVLVQSVSKTEN